MEAAMRAWLTGLTVALVAAGAAQADVSARLVCPTNVLYVGQLFPLTLELRAENVQFSRQIGIDGLPPSEVLLIEPFDPLPTETVQRDGRSVEIRRFRCSARALQPGPLRIAPVLNATAVESTRTYFFVQQYERALRIAVAPLDCRILPLPAEGRPEDFSGAVGQFSLRLDVAPTDVAVGDLVTVTITVEGDGALDGLGAPPLSVPTSFRAYEARAVAEESRLNRRVFRRTLVPLDRTAAAVPSVGLTFFDPVEARYHRVTAGPVALTFHDERAPAAAFTNAEPPGATSYPRLPLAPTPGRWSASGPDSPGQQFQEAARAYAQGDAAGALSRYARLQASGLSAPELAHNLGCAALQMGDTGHAVASLRAAWYQAPADPLVRRSLAAALASAGQPDPDRHRPGRWFLRWPSALWKGLAAAGAIGLALSLGLRLVGVRTMLWQAPAAFFSALLVAGAAGAWVWHLRLDDREAVVTAPSGAVLRVAPAAAAPVVSEADRATIVLPGESHAGWVRVQHEDRAGWVPAEVLTPVALP
jgi:hypothetical protein